jgi:hypothetical protein
MAAAVVSSTLNMVHTMAGLFRSDKPNPRKPRQGTETLSGPPEDLFKIVR